MNVSYSIDPAYTSLNLILRQAYERAAIGKGKARHGSGVPFREQPMQSISEFLGSSDGLAFQVLKKLHESKRLPHDQARNELLDCIVYLAGMVLFLDNAEARTPHQAIDVIFRGPDPATSVGGCESPYGSPGVAPGEQ